MDSSPAPATPLAQALDDFAALLPAEGTEPWSASTPCVGWSVRDLVNHVTAGNLLVASLLAGVPRPGPEEIARRRSTDFLGDDPIRAYRSSADGLVAAFTLPGALKRPITLPIGTIPGSAVAGLRLTETIVHGWDLGMATARPAHFSDASVGDALAFTRRALTDLPPGNRAFGTGVTPPDGASPLQELVSLLGRDCGWTPGRS